MGLQNKLCECQDCCRLGFLYHLQNIVVLSQVELTLENMHTVSLLVPCLTYALIGCFHRNEHYALRKTRVAANNPGTHSERICVAS